MWRSLLGRRLTRKVTGDSEGDRAAEFLQFEREGLVTGLEDAEELACFIPGGGQRQGGMD
jgi:hypothetical protein